jgi:hypothetical protein
MDAARPSGAGNDQQARAGWPPPPAGLRPMLAVPVTELPQDEGWSFEPKWDGYRGIGTLTAGQVRIASRRGLDMAAWFAELPPRLGAWPPPGGGRRGAGRPGRGRPARLHRPVRSSASTGCERRLERLAVLFVLLEGVADQPRHRRPQPHEDGAPLGVAPLFPVDGLGADPQRQAQHHRPQRRDLQVHAPQSQRVQPLASSLPSPRRRGTGVLAPPLLLCSHPTGALTRVRLAVAGSATGRPDENSRGSGGLARQVGALGRWPVGMGLASWRYLWRTSPLRRTDQQATAQDLGPAAARRPGRPARAAHPRRRRAAVSPPLRRAHRGLVGGARAAGRHLARNPNRAAPVEVAFCRATRGRCRSATSTRCACPGPWDGPVRVVDRSPTSFRLATLRGHLQAGQIEFRAGRQGIALRLEVGSWARSGDRLSALLYDRVGLVKEVQLHAWTHCRERIGRLAGGRIRGGIRVDARRVGERPGGEAKPLGTPAAGPWTGCTARAGTSTRRGVAGSPLRTAGASTTTASRCRPGRPAGRCATAAGRPPAGCWATTRLPTRRSSGRSTTPTVRWNGATCCWRPLFGCAVLLWLPGRRGLRPAAQRPGTAGAGLGLELPDRAGPPGAGAGGRRGVEVAGQRGGGVLRAADPTVARPADRRARRRPDENPATASAAAARRAVTTSWLPPSVKRGRWMWTAWASPFWWCGWHAARRAGLLRRWWRVRARRREHRPGSRGRHARPRRPAPSGHPWSSWRQSRYCRQASPGCPRPGGPRSAYDGRFGAAARRRRRPGRSAGQS